MRGVGCVRICASGREGEWENTGEKISSSPAFVCVREEVK